MGDQSQQSAVNGGHILYVDGSQSAVNGGHICGCEFAKNVLYYPNKSCVQGQKDAGGFFS